LDQDSSINPKGSMEDAKMIPVQELRYLIRAFTSCYTSSIHIKFGSKR